jgi:hypothetical protein
MQLAALQLEAEQELERVKEQGHVVVSLDEVDELGMVVSV